MSAARIEELRAEWDRAVERDRPADAVTALAALEMLEADEPRWSQRLGEAHRRLGKMHEAEEAFVRAAERYADKGFLPRAIAMAKLASSINPAHGDLLARLEPKKVVAKPPPLPARAAVPPPLPARPVPLRRAQDSHIDEVRFTDVEDASSLDIMLTDIEDLEVIESVDLVVSERLPEPREPSIDRLGAMATFRLFAGLSREALLDLADAAELVELIPGAMMMVRGERAFAMYAIIDGIARVTVRGSPSIRLGEGDIVGEGCLLDEGERQADVRAETPLMALRIEKKKLDEVTERHAAIGDALFQLLARRLVMNLMHASPLFTTFEPKVRLELAQLFEVRRAEPGTVLSEQGKRSDGLYVLLSGNVSATGAGGKTTRIARGSAFGHASLVGVVGAAETVKTQTEAVLLRLPASKFAALAATYPPVLALLAEMADDPLPASVLLE
ncbi:MAG: regulatory subunit-like protein [Labilithrix sp.]|nr:regulatory subunit-like protein [Labilithrix sp.]